MDTARAATWLKTNWLSVLAVASWLTANIAPRPHPSEAESKWTKLFWTVVDRVSFLTANHVPGKLKWVFAGSPLPPTAEAQAPSDTSAKEENKGSES